ncbi:nitroreductase family protein [Pigmentiphaga litoralis]|uniref:nitroreductase family protein n=1 Tax=Pigmentiphaga litoralis TaxID=516702 RepID=UPI003B4386FA
MQEACDVLDLLRAHRSERAFTGAPVSDDTLEHVFDAARRSPTWNNAQNVSWVVVRHAETRARLAAYCGNQAWIAKTPVFVVLLMDFHKTALAARKQGRDQVVHHDVNSLLIGGVDTGIVMATMMTAARALGLDVCPIGGVRRQMQDVIDLLELPPLVVPMAGICMGYAETRSSLPKPRFDLAASWHDEVYRDHALADAIDTLDARMHDYSRALGRPDAQNWSDAISSRYAVPTYTTVAATLVRQGFRFPMPTAEDTAPSQ